MLAYKLTLEDGTVLDSSVIRSVTLTEQVSDQTDLCPGAACAACAEIELWAPGNALAIAQGAELTLARLDTTSGGETPAGIFLAEKPEKVSANVIRVTAYDRMTLLDKNLSPWLREQQGAFPMRLDALIRSVCAQCGAALADGTLDALPNAGYKVAAFYADNLTGRKLIQWAAQAACRFARMTPDGKLEFAWYTAGKSTGIGPSNIRLPTRLRLAGQVLRTAAGEIWRFGTMQAGYLSGTLSYEDYETVPIDKVQIKQSDDDVGTIYPPDEAGTNALVLQGNLLLTTASADTLRPVAQAIYGQMQGVSYTPLSISVQAVGDLPAPGEILSITDAYGRAMTAYIMKRTISGQKVTLESTGNATRDGTAAVNEQSYSNLTGKLLEISTSVDGLRVVNKDLQGSLASLELTVDGIETNVQKQLDDMTDYVDQETGQIKDQAVSEAVSSALSQVDSKLQFYPTESEMQSAISQSASEINLSVSQTLRGYSTTSQMQQYVNGQTSGILQDAQDYTDGRLDYYPTTVEMNSAIKQSASSINLTVNEKLTMYPTNSDMQDYVDGQLQDYSTTVEMNSAISQSASNINLSVSQTLRSYSTTSQMQSYVNGQTSGILSDAQDYTDQQVQSRPTTVTVQNMIDVGIEGITLSASTNGNTSTIRLTHDGATISSANISFTGFVTFSALSGSGTSTINGDNISTGTLGSAAGNTVYDLDAGTIRTGRSNGNHVDINDRGISWYVENNGQSWLTGVLYSIFGTSYLGANSQYTIYGWVDSTTPSRWNGMQVDNNASQCLFNTNHVDVQHDLGVSGTVSTRDLSAWGNKNRIVRTPIGNLAFAAMESPEPAFCDWGGGTIGEDGICPVCFSQQYAAGISLRQAARWLVTPLDGEGSFWVERTDWGALIHGRPGSRFDWLCIGVQFDMAGVYAPESNATPPVEKDEAVDLARDVSMDSERNEQDLEKLMEGSR